MGTAGLATAREGRALEALGPVRGRRVLDAGCGGGGLVERLGELGAEAWGLDLRSGALRGDLRRLPFAGGSFDAAVCLLVLHYLPEPQGALRELARVLRPGGRLVLADRTASADPSLRAAQDVVERLRNPSLGRLLSPEELEGALMEAGFALEERADVEETVEVEAWTTSPAARRELEALRGRDLGGLRVGADGHLDLRIRLLGASIRAR